MVLAAASVASCQAGQPPGAAESQVQIADAGEPGAGAPSTSLVFRRVFLSGSGGEASMPSDITGCTGFPQVKALAVGPGDDVWIAGSFFAPLQLDATELTSAGRGDAFVLRLDPTGNLRWARRLGGPENESCRGMAVDTEENALVAYQNPEGGMHQSGPIQLVKLGGNGDLLWQRTVVPPGREEMPVYVASAASDRAAGMLLVAGNIDEQFVARLDAKGDTIWKTSPLPLADSEPVDLASDGEGNALVGAGSSVGPTVHLIKVSASGAVDFKKRFRGSGYGIDFHSVGADLRGNILLSGFGGTDLAGPGSTPLEHRNDRWIAKLDASGNRIWQVFGVVGSMAADGEGNVLYANLRTVGKLSPSGDWIWKYSPQVDGQGTVGAVATDSAGRVIYAGTFKGRVDFGDGPVESGERPALFVAALAP
jgi:hypothetical protein